MTATPKLWWTKAMRETHAFNCQPGYSPGEQDFEAETQEVFGFCGCGQPEVIRDGLRRYLESCADHFDGGAKDWAAWYKAHKERHPILDEPIFWFCAYLADKAEWTEHGGSVNSAWLTPQGEAWLKDAQDYEETGHD